MHHSDPMFMGGNANQELTPMSESRHYKLHPEMNKYLYNVHDNDGNHMAPYPGNNRFEIQKNFDRPWRINALKGFYDSHPIKYWDARFYFYRNNDMLKQWRPW